jgi:hypothetical protein
MYPKTGKYCHVILIIDLWANYPRTLLPSVVLGSCCTHSVAPHTLLARLAPSAVHGGWAHLTGTEWGCHLQFLTVHRLMKQKAHVSSPLLKLLREQGPHKYRHASVWETCHFSKSTGVSLWTYFPKPSGFFFLPIFILRSNHYYYRKFRFK